MVFALGCGPCGTLLFDIPKIRTDEISGCMSDLIAGLYEDLLWLDERIETITGEIEKIAAEQAACTLLPSVPGVGPVILTAMVAAIGDGEAFDRGSDFGPGSVWFHDNTTSAAEPRWGAYRNRATHICACCSSRPRRSSF